MSLPNFYGWAAGEPTTPGYYWVAQPDHGRWGGPWKLIGLACVVNGPRGGYMKPRWVEPLKHHVSWQDHYLAAPAPMPPPLPQIAFGDR